MESTYTVEGMTCGHCVAAVTEEVKLIPGVTDVAVVLVQGHVVDAGRPHDIEDRLSQAYLGG